MNANQGSDQNVDVPGLDLLHGAEIEVGLLGQLFLGDASGRPLPPDVGTEQVKVGLESAAGRHAPLRRVYLLELNGILGRNRGVTADALEAVLRELNRQILSMPEADLPEWNQHREVMGVLNGKPFHSDSLKVHFPQRTGRIKGKTGLGSSPIRMRVEACIDDWSKGRQDDLPVVIAVSLNHNVDHANIEKSLTKLPYAELNLRPRLEAAFAMALSNAGDKSHGRAVPEPGKYHLIAFYLFPWITDKEFGVGMTEHEQNLMLYGYGYRDPLFPLLGLINAIRQEGSFPWIVFHGSSSIIQCMAMRFAAQRDTQAPDVLVCDQLSESGLMLNSLVLGPNNAEKRIGQ